MTETWKPIPDFPGYDVSDYGQIRRNGYILSPWLSTKRYLRVSLYVHNTGHKRYMHRLVAEAFLGPAPCGCEVHHINGNKRDNRAGNLVWINKVEHARGENGSGAKLTANQVRKIRELHATRAYLHKELAESFGVARETITNILTGKTWGYLAPQAQAQEA